MNRIGGQAVVIGASMAGLLAARVLSEAYEEVTVLDRDVLPPLGEGRRAVPQGRHIHSLHPRGLDAIEELFPGFAEEIHAAGAPTWEGSSELRFAPGGRELVRSPFGIGGIVCSRAFLEGHVLRRLRALHNVMVRDRCQVTDLVADRDNRRIVGVRLRPAGGGEDETDGEALRADLVLAATGRASQVPAWLASLGYDAPAEDRLDVDVRYASCELRLPDGALAGDKIVIYPATPERSRTIGLFAIEGSRHLLTAAGYGDDAPPADPEGLLEFTATVTPADVVAAVRAAEPLTEIARFRFPANVRRRYERLRRFPDGFLVAGDAVCSFNPVYGQGMSVAALEALALRACLRKGGNALARRYLKAVAKVVTPCWAMATGADLSLPVVEGHRPLPVRVLNAYTARVQAVAAYDPKVAEAFLRVVTMLEPPAHILRPSIARRVLRKDERPQQDRATAGRDCGSDAMRARLSASSIGVQSAAIAQSQHRRSR